MGARAEAGAHGQPAGTPDGSGREGQGDAPGHGSGAGLGSAGPGRNARRWPGQAAFPPGGRAMRRRSPPPAPRGGPRLHGGGRHWGRVHVAPRAGLAEFPARRDGADQILPRIPPRGTIATLKIDGAHDTCRSDAAIPDHGHSPEGPRQEARQPSAATRRGARPRVRAGPSGWFDRAGTPEVASQPGGTASTPSARRIHGVIPKDSLSASALFAGALGGRGARRVVTNRSLAVCMRRSETIA